MATLAGNASVTAEVKWWWLVLTCEAVTLKVAVASVLTRAVIILEITDYLAQGYGEFGMICTGGVTILSDPAFQTMVVEAFEYVNDGTRSRTF